MPELQKVHITSFVVHCLPEHLDAAALVIAQLDGTEIHDRSAKGKLVVLLECEDEQQILDSIYQMEAIAGVLAATMVYHQFDVLD